MTSQNQQNRVVMTPDPATGAPTMSPTESPTQPPIPAESISELEYAVKLDRGTRAMYNLRQAGKLPPHFYVPTSRGAKQQVRYLLADIEAFDQAKQKSQTQK